MKAATRVVGRVMRAAIPRKAGRMIVLKAAVREGAAGKRRCAESVAANMRRGGKRRYRAPSRRRRTAGSRQRRAYDPRSRCSARPRGRRGCSSRRSGFPVMFSTTKRLLTPRPAVASMRAMRGALSTGRPRHGRFRSSAVSFRRARGSERNGGVLLPRLGGCGRDAYSPMPVCRYRLTGAAVPRARAAPPTSMPNAGGATAMEKRRTAGPRQEAFLARGLAATHLRRVSAAALSGACLNLRRTSAAVRR